MAKTYSPIRTPNGSKTYSRIFKPKEEVRSDEFIPIVISSELLPIDCEDACRLCLCKDEIMVDIFDSSDIIPLTMKIKSVLEIEVEEDDDLPSMICVMCVQQLNEAFKFKTRCVAIDSKLRQFLREFPDRAKSSSSVFENNNESLNLPEDLSNSECRVVEDEVLKAKTVSEDNVSNCVDRSNEIEVQDVVQSSSQQFEDQNEELPESAVDAQDLLNRSDGGNDPLPEQGERPSPGTLPEPDSSSKKQRRLRSYIRNNSVEVLPDEVPLQTRLEFHLKYQNRACLVETWRKCKKCKLVFDLYQYKNHFMKCMRASACPTCKKFFNTPSLLKRHMTVHTGERRFTCQDCGSAFSQNESLMRHTAQLHSPKFWVCSVCDKRYGLKYLLREHMKTHSKEVTYPCKQCKKVFRYATGLSRHKQRHDGTMFSCRVCNKRFTDTSSVNRHLKQSHSITMESNHNYSNEMESEDNEDGELDPDLFLFVPDVS